MDKLKKDLMFVYLIRNAIASFIIAYGAFVIGLMDYYGDSFSQVTYRIFIENIYTLSFFLLLCILNYLLFELFKIICDFIYAHLKANKKDYLTSKKISILYFLILFPIVLLMIALAVDGLYVLKLDFIFLTIFMVLRSLKELYYKEIKNRLSLF